MKKKMVKLMLLTMAVTGMSFASLGNEVFAEETEVSEQAEDVSTQGETAQLYSVSKNGGNWDGTHYYFADGTMAKNCFFCDGTYTYYLQNDGTAMRDRLTYHPDGEHIIYFDGDGHEVFSNFTHVKKSIEGNPVDDLCFFDVFGHMYTDVVTYDQAGVNLYYANPYGVMERNGWFEFSAKQGGGMGYANADGTLMKDQWTYDQNGNYVYMEGDGSVRGSRENQGNNGGNSNTQQTVYTGRNGVNPLITVSKERFDKATGSHGKISFDGDTITYGGYTYPVANINATSANYSGIDARGYDYGNTWHNGVNFAGVFNGEEYSAYGLRKAGFNKDNAIEHFCCNGIYEGRIDSNLAFYSQNYAVNYYDELSKMYGNDYVYYALDWLAYGHAEGRIADHVVDENSTMTKEAMDSLYGRVK